jgi:hypothetical protein
MNLRHVPQTSSQKTKKYRVTFIYPNSNPKTIHFGAKGYSDYTLHRDNKRRQRYQLRHQHDPIDQFDTAGSLAW